jgi:GDP-L-fucose synthase
MSRVLITGAAGFLGSHFVRYHLAQGDEIVGVDDLSGIGAEWTEGEYVRREQDAFHYLERCSEEFDLAYHFAAPVGGRVRIEGDPLYNARSLALDAAFFRWAIDRTSTAVYPSSSAVYGTYLQRGEGMALPEKALDLRRDQWGRPDEMYGFTKMAGEVLARAAAG